MRYIGRSFGFMFQLFFNLFIRVPLHSVGFYKERCDFFSAGCFLIFWVFQDSCFLTDTYWFLKTPENSSTISYEGGSYKTILNAGV